MKKIVLIGDSIRIAYQATVRQRLADVADVWGPEINCGDTLRVLAYLDNWMLSQQPDLVHINCGLHDIKIPDATGVYAVPLAEYRANVREILTRIRQQTQADIIWATMTPVNSVMHREHMDSQRFEADVDAYNAAAVAVARDLNVPVNDLFAVVRDAGPERLWAPDGLHYIDEGYAMMGRVVAQVIRAAI